ncbi:MAG TPA: hypothetical protein VFU71_05100 [Burkholderiaceae bacterium]|nr:hypothetical protein [Burkholderiaceae bacterium]
MRLKSFVVVACLLSAAGWASAGNGQGLTIDGDRTSWPLWQARLQLATEPLTPALSSFDGASLRPRSAALLGDYYVTRPYLGQTGGLRVTSGVVAGTRGAVFGPGQATPPGSFGISTLSRPVSGAPIDGSGDSTLAWPYLGVGYSDSSLRSGWGFSADLGLAAQNVGAARWLGSQALDDIVRDMRLTPVLQLGVSYRF